jgi:hypothetical protein
MHSSPAPSRTDSLAAAFGFSPIERFLMSHTLEAAVRLLEQDARTTVAPQRGR